MAHFHVGQKVTVFKPFPACEIQRAKDEGVTLPVLGVVYTVRGMEPGVWNSNETFIRLAEIVNGPHVEDGIEPSFSATRFRPVIERKTDISIFKAMLNPSKQGVPA
jgi:hypothetical protein